MRDKSVANLKGQLCIAIMVIMANIIDRVLQVKEASWKHHLLVESQ